MAMTFKQWLKLKFDKLMSVQRTALDSDYADIVIHLWDGNRIRIHMIDAPTNPRTLRKSLSDATQIGVNTLFMVDARILPEDNARVQAKDWMMALHTLNDDRIYAYRVIDGEPEVFQVHFASVVHTSEHKIWYGPKIKFDGLRHTRRSFKLRSIKGDWLVADFGAPAFWKNMDFRAARAKQERAHHFNTHWHEWSTFRTWQATESDESNNGNGEKERKTPPRTSLGDYLTDCYRLLGVERSASQEEVKKAFRRRAMVFHPDTSELPPEEAEQKFKMLNAAYDYIKAANGW